MSACVCILLLYALLLVKRYDVSSGITPTSLIHRPQEGGWCLLCTPAVCVCGWFVWVHAETGACARFTAQGYHNDQQLQPEDL